MIKHFQLALQVILLVREFECRIFFRNRNFLTQNDSPNVYRSYQLQIYCNASEKILYPRRKSDITYLVSRARKLNVTLKAIGSRHSLTDIICTEGTPITTEKMTKMKLHRDMSATFGGGVKLEDAMVYLEKAHRTLIQVPTYGGITIAGALGTGAHGSSLLHPASLSDQVIAVKVMDGEGKVRDVTGEDLKAFKVHLGLLGIILEVTFDTVPLFKQRVHNTLEKESVLFDGAALNWAHEYDKFEMWWFPTFSRVVVSKGTYVDVDVPGNATTNFIPHLSPFFARTTSSFMEALQRSENQGGIISIEKLTKKSLFMDVFGKPPIFTENGLTVKNPAVGYAWRLQSNRCLESENAFGRVCPWISEGVLPEESSVAFDISQFKRVMRLIKHVLREYPVSFFMIGLFIRFQKASDAYLSLASGRTTFSVEWVLPMRKNPFEHPKMGLAAVQTLVQEMIHHHEGRPHWGKNGMAYFTREIFQKSYPQENRMAFKKVMEKYDKRGLFQNKFGRRLFYNSREIDKDPKVSRCALQDHCICQTSVDCGPSQKCSTINGFNFNVCKDLYAIFNAPELHSFTVNTFDNFIRSLNPQS